MKKILMTCLWLTLAGCATPIITLKNPSTGQVVQCGGSASGSLAGGVIGHNIQKNSDQSCARSYEARGFKRV
jgi:uncharacterized protein YcfJ